MSIQATSHSELPVASVGLLPRGSWLAVILVFLFVLTEAAIATALAITLAAGFFRDFLFARLRSRALAEIRWSMFHRLQSLSMQFHEALDHNQMLERFSTDPAWLASSFGHGRCSHPARYPPARREPRTKRTNMRPAS
jgi:ABC-type multidrug transport system fused ATPase/permease subunit